MWEGRHQGYDLFDGFHQDGLVRLKLFLRHIVILSHVQWPVDTMGMNGERRNESSYSEN
jgi:hypothetical protein